MSVEWKRAPNFDESKLAEDGAAEQAPKRSRAKKPSPPVSRPGTSGKPSLKTSIGGLLVMVNVPVQMFMTADALDPAEIDALAAAMDEQCKISPRFRRYVEAMLGVGTGGQLLVVAGMVAGRRAARHGMLGENGEAADRALGERLQDMTGMQATMPQYVRKEPTQQPVQETPSGGEFPPVGSPPAS